MDLQLKEKKALISGSTKGIGFAIALGLAREGAEVIINGRSQSSVDEALAKLSSEVSGSVVHGFAGDLSSADATAKLVAAFPHVDILVNNLGIFEPKPFLEIPDEDWRHFYEVNVLSGVRLSRSYLSGMLNNDWGRIIFISSESAIQLPAEMIHYGVTKTAQIAVARGIAETVAGTGVTVNSVLPGPTHSEGVNDFVEQVSGGQSFEEFETEFFESVRPSSLIRRFATTEEVANLVVYLSSPLASATTGAALRVDGGVIRACV